MNKSFFIDTTICIGCRGCQIACKQWHELPGEKTINRGTHENPPDLSFDTYKLVRMREQVVSDKLKWLFFPEQCRHCIDAPCLETAGYPSAIYRDDATGAIVFTEETKNLDADEIIESCPYNIPRKGPDGSLAKCDMCIDRIKNNMLPACVQTCPTGAMNFGNRDQMRELGNKRLNIVRQTCPEATLIDAENVSVIYLTAYSPALYHENALAWKSNGVGITRYAALRQMMRPLSAIFPRRM